MLNRDFREFIQSLNDNDVRHMIVGGYAVALHGHPRYTKDIDVWIEMSAENAARMIAALEQFRFGSLGLTAADFLVPQQVVQLGQPPNRIDILVKLSGVEFEACYKSRITVDIDGVAVSIINLEDLKKNKRAAGRLQDLADVENLE
ncbi:MAG: nucleotidyltransferase [Acidobacteriota bacterium]|nr:nucleotidyltransferase [Acidobacteriota bacterium]